MKEATRMKEEYLKLYSKDEQRIMESFKALFNEWHKHVGEKDGCWFVPDGFYPNY